MSGINGCFCRTKWYEYSKPFKRKCKKPPEDVTDKLEAAMEKELEKKRSELDGKVGGSIQFESDLYPDGGSHPSGAPTYSRKGRKFTTPDWFRYRNLKGSYKPSPEPECEDWPDKQPIVGDGYKYVTSQECDCTYTNAGVKEGEAEAVQTEQPDGTESKVTTLQIKIEWEEWSGQTFGELVPYPEQELPEPEEDYKGKNDERSTELTLEWEKYYEILRFKQNYWIDHQCP
jgi:hypothetical protein